MRTDALVIQRLGVEDSIGRYQSPPPLDRSWLFGERTSRAGTLNLFLVRDGDAAVGNLGFIPQPLRLHGSGVPSCYLLALGVEESHRGRGLAKRLLEAVHAEQTTMIMVGMTAAAQRLYERLGYTDHGLMVQLFRIVQPLAAMRYIAAHGSLHPMARWLGRLPLPGGDKAADRSEGTFRSRPSWAWRSSAESRRSRFVRGLPAWLEVTGDRPGLSELDAFFDAVAGAHGCIAERDGSFVAWRYWRCPKTRYGEYYLRERGRLDGYAFTKMFLHPKGMRVGVVTDLLVARNDHHGMGALLRLASLDLERAGAEVIKCSFTPSWARRVAEHLGFLDPKRLLPRGWWPGRRVFSAPGPVPLPLSLEDWWLTRGDSEMDFNDAVPGSTMLDPGAP